MLVRADQGVSVVGMLIAAYAAVFLSASMGITLGLLAAFSFAWFTAAHALVRRGIALGVIRWVSPLYEIAMPGLALCILVFVQGPEYALGSWVPPQLFSIFIAASILRLRPGLPFVLGLIAALEYGACYLLFIHGRVEGAGLLLRPVTHLVRVGALVLTGVGGSAAVLGLRRAIAAANRDVRARDLFGKYRLGPEIASGGMGRVMQATYCPEGGFERKVAIKLIHPHLARDASFVDRFRAEAALCARLAHPNIVAALDFGSVDGTYFFAMEFVDGPTLSTLLRHRIASDHPLPPHLVVHIGRQVAEGLHFAHAGALDEQGRPMRVIHRDLSPGNVLLDRSGQVKISDFGVAHALGAAQAVHTRTLMGKPSYMAPEQLRHQPVDERADLFALAIVLWEMCANRYLFRRESESATMFAVLEEPIPAITTLRPELTSEWDRFFARALCRDRDRRIHSGAELIAALALLEDLAGSAHPEDIAALVAPFLETRKPDLAPTEILPEPRG